MYNQINLVFVACEVIICFERDLAYYTMIQFVLKNSKQKNNSENTYVIVADDSIYQAGTAKKFSLPNDMYMCDTWNMFDSILCKQCRGTSTQVLF